MKNIFLLAVVLLLNQFNLFSQGIVCRGDSARFNISGYSTGEIQWQYSASGINWDEIPGASDSIINILITDPGFVRASVKNGNCTFYTDTTLISLADSAECISRDSIAEINKRTTIGAIRWDAGWVGDVSQIPLLSQQQLSPSKFRFRTPFFATVHKEDSISFKYTQSIMDQEIEFAKSSGINYWLYNWYPDNSGFDIPIDLHLSSSHKEDIKFSYIFYSSNWKYVKNELPLTMSRMKLSNYMQIDGKPLVFCMNNTWTIDDINELKSEAAKAGIPDIYLVIMEWTGATAIQKCTEYGAQASSAYCNWGDGGISYSAMASATESKWNTYKSSSYAFIPFVTTGWDPRPFIEFYKGLSEADSISLSTWYPKPADDHYVLTATSEEVASHLKAGLDWVKKNPNYSAPNTVIIYAWNECTEGGFIIPVAETDSSAINYGTKRLDAIKLMLNEYWNK